MPPRSMYFPRKVIGPHVIEVKDELDDGSPRRIARLLLGAPYLVQGRRRLMLLAKFLRPDDSGQSCSTEVSSSSSSSGSESKEGEVPSKKPAGRIKAPVRK